MKYKKKFKNELENNIVVNTEEVEDENKDALFDAVKITIEGPESISENTVTYMEANRLRESISDFLEDKGISRSTIKKKVRARKIKQHYKLAYGDKEEALLSHIKCSWKDMTCDKLLDPYYDLIVSLGFMAPDGTFYDLRRLQRRDIPNHEDYSEFYFGDDFGHESFANNFSKYILDKKDIVRGTIGEDGSLTLLTRLGLLKRKGWVILSNTNSIAVKDSWFRVMTGANKSIEIPESEKAGMKSLILYLNRCDKANGTSFDLSNYETNERVGADLITFNPDKIGVVDSLIYENKLFGKKDQEELERALYV